ncbi:transcriptional regulator [Vibrio splendidus]|uniref:transcriptional regulator n=1 Tax=Vibrio TaxID=662 RepID=UPI0003011CCD|nr:MULTISPECIES: transcriptional regulator [Vibrio]OCH51632.1 transcriptional regulator [Vibrio lentus]PMK84191.1 transcriptional regulator [Vibrio lentus]PML07657.1 transcriptional regulator [Vibrio lentus]PTP05111.1 transcriptional regulator [Vibrio splendidus]PTP22291.1 transcriptional regulator [Vibrio splendidus]
MEPSKYKYPITAKLIRDARLRSGLQQKDFISQNNLEITQATFSRWETGQAQVPVNVLLKLGLVSEAIVL